MRHERMPGVAVEIAWSEPRLEERRIPCAPTEVPEGAGGSCSSSRRLLRCGAAARAMLRLTLVKTEPIARKDRRTVAMHEADVGFMSSHPLLTRAIRRSK
jgi:hypothetical protein